MTILARIQELYTSIANEVNLLRQRSIKGTVLLDFNNGELMASVSVLNPLIDVSDVIICWVSGEPTIDHSSDEQLVEEIKVIGVKNAGIGFTVYGLAVTKFPLFGKYSVSYIIHKT